MSLHIGGRGVCVSAAEIVSQEMEKGVWSNLALVADCSGGSVGLRLSTVHGTGAIEMGI